jgi:hypothetical protein
LARQNAESHVVRGAVLLLEDPAQTIHDQARRDHLEIETLNATQNSDRDLVDLRRRENEFHMRRWLFQRLQKGVPSRLRKHMDFINDDDFVTIATRSVG